MRMLAPILVLASAPAWAAPDLSVREVVAPLLVVEGTSAEVSFKASSGREAADFEYALVHSPNGLLSDASVWLRGTAHVEANAEVEIHGRIAMPAGVIGRGFFGVVLDPDQRIAETNELDDAAIASAPTRIRRALPDLVIDSVRVVEPQVGPGEVAHVDVIVRNVGELSAAMEASIRLSANAALSTDDLEIGRTDLSIDAGESTTVRVDALIPPGTRAGDYTVGVILDPDLSVAETHVGDVRAAPYVLNVRVEQLSLGTVDLPNGTVFIAYHALLSATGGDGHHRFRIASGRLPDGVVLDSNGVVSGVPLDSGTFEVEISVASLGLAASKRFTIDVARSGVALVIATPELEVGTVSLPYHLELVAAGGEPPYAWDAPELPSGLDLTPSGILTGIPLLQGTYRVEIRVADAIGNEDSKVFELVVESPNVVVGSGTIGPYETGAELDVELAISGGRPPYHVVPVSTPPPGLSVTEDGHLVGAPTEVGLFPVRIRATDSSSNLVSDTGIVFVSIAPAGTFQIATLDPPNAVVRRPYAFPLEIVGGVEPVSFWLVPGDQLPDGFTLEPSVTAPGRSVVLTGMSVRPGTTAFTIVAEDATGRRSEAALSLTIVRPDTQVGDGGCRCTAEAGSPAWLLLGGLLLLRRRR
ncbi:MAG: hypothetical protein HYV07_26920 [Deltaproteobacteria bacterium]|nr:hypothetical protein [Deltaproteobacteria bacterium]